MEADFSGYATKAGLKCSDGRTIMPEAFAHMDGKMVPLVWQHGHNTPENVLGHALLEARDGDLYAYAFFNETAPAKHIKEAVQHKDINMLSIYANGLVERSKQVFHGMVREVSVCISGANPGALIDYVAIAHSDGSIETIEDEAVIYTGLGIVLSNADTTDIAHKAAVEDERTVQEIYDTLNEEQRNVVNFMLATAFGAASELAQSDQDVVDPDSTPDEIYNALSDAQKTAVQTMISAATAAVQHSDDTTKKGPDAMSRNVFEQTAPKAEGTTLSHDQIATIVADAQKMGSLKESVLAHAQDYGITDIDFLFPDAKTVGDMPDLIARRTEWVSKVLGGAQHSPFARIKSIGADITAEEARAKGYVKGNLKKDEIIRLLKRVTIPTTVYKKQKLDRDDIVDITDFNVVAWLKWEMRFMLEEELARAILIGDGREPDDADKIDEEKLRPIAWDADLYSHSVTVPANTDAEGIMESVLRARKFYKGTGRPSFYTTDDILTDMILLKDKVGRRKFNTEAEVAAALRVAEVVVVEVMEDVPDLLGIIVNMADYKIGADKGGEISMFDDFDIDYNQQKYLIETRASGALTKFKSAVVIKRTNGTTVTPTAPTYNAGTHTITIPTIAGVTYYNVTDILSEVSLSAGALVITKTTDIEARPNTGYNFPHNIDADWTYAYTA